MSRQGHSINLVIIIENAHFIREKNKNLENNFKYWIPKILPPRIKLILTLPIISYNLPFLNLIDAKMIKLKLNHN